MRRTLGDRFPPLYTTASKSGGQIEIRSGEETAGRLTIEADGEVTVRLRLNPSAILEIEGIVAAESNTLSSGRADH